MQRHEVRTMLRKRPFAPFRVFVSGGEVLDVRHQELFVLGRDSVFIGFPDPKDPEPEYDRFTIVDLAHIIRVEPLAAPAPKGKKSQPG
jgi:hypothetical protein